MIYGAIYFLVGLVVGFLSGRYDIDDKNPIDVSALFMGLLWPVTVMYLAFVVGHKTRQYKLVAKVEKPAAR